MSASRRPRFSALMAPLFLLTATMAALPLGATTKPRFEGVPPPNRVLTPAAQAGFEHLEALLRKQNLEKDLSLEGIAIDSQGATLSWKSAENERPRLRLGPPGEGIAIGPFFMLSSDHETARNKKLIAMLKPALLRAFPSNPWRTLNPLEETRGRQSTPPALPPWWAVALGLFLAMASLGGIAWGFKGER